MRRPSTPENSHLFAATGAAIDETPAEAQPLSMLIRRLDSGVQMDFELKRLPALFEDEADLEAFRTRHHTAVVPRGDLATYNGDCFLGFDAGSTTTKPALVGEKGELLYSFYANNQARSPSRPPCRRYIRCASIFPQAHISRAPAPRATAKRCSSPRSRSTRARSRPSPTAPPRRFSTRRSTACSISAGRT